MRKLFSFFKKGMIIMMALLMTFGYTDVIAFAIESSQNTIYFEDSYENPLYEAENDGEVIEYITGAYLSDIKYDSAGTDIALIKEAAIAVRDNMIARNENFKITIASPSSDHKQLVTEIFQLAIGDELANSPVAGDYLAWQYGGYSYKGSAKIADGKYSYTFDFTVSYYTTVNQENQVTQAINNAFDEIHIDRLDDYGKIKGIYDYICKACDYDYSTVAGDYTKFSAYGAIIKGTAVCQGYSTLLYRMLEEAGINCKIITSTNHSWNIVELDGIYYNVDATWDDNYYNAGRDYVYFLKCDEHFNHDEREPQYRTDEFNRKYVMTPVCYDDLLEELGLGDDVGFDSGLGLSEEDVKAPEIASYAVDTTTFLYNGKVLAPKVTIVDTDDYTLVENTDYTVVYPNSKNVGKYEFKVVLAGVYSGEKTFEYTIKPRTANTALTAIAGGFKVNWSKQAEATGYQVQYATKSDFSNAATIYGGNAASTNKSITGRANGTRYYVRVRAYAKVGDTYYYGAWSAGKNITTPAKPSTAKLASASGVKNGFTVKWGKVSGITGYQIQYSTNADFKNAATVYAGNANATAKTITGRAANTRYYVRVRAYKNVNGTTMFGDWSSYKQVVTKK